MKKRIRGIHDRLRKAGLSLWEMGDLLGIHPHQLGAGPQPELIDQPVRVLIEIARQLDIHPADLVAEFHGVLGKRRQPHHGQSGTADKDALDDTGGDDGLRHDTLTVLTALATASTPLSVDELATALRWPLPRITATLNNAYDHPDVAGPLALRRVAPERYTLTPRLDTLTDHERTAIHDTDRSRGLLDEHDALVLLTALAEGDGPRYLAHRASESWRYTERALKGSGLLYSRNGPHHVSVADDVLFSLRYRTDDHITRERDEYMPQGGQPWPEFAIVDEPSA
ncbi:hypothetical protein AB0J52_00895 [Spirillospora sp. NPDC049652]